ncbi:MAG: DUF4249 domain-containing protein [Bacteroidota bacterium]
MRHLFGLLFLTACVQAFDPEIDAVDVHPIIIDALLTNENLNHEVRINRAQDINESPFVPIDNADIYVEDNEGATYEYERIERGRYASINAFAGVVGMSYRVVISIDGETYESGFEEMRTPGDVDDVSAQFGIQSLQSETGEITNEPVVDILASLTFDGTDESYFRFDWEATYEARTPSQGTGICWNERGETPPSNLELKSCYISDRPNSFLRLFSTERVQGNSINSIKIFSVNPNRRFQIRYSPEITTYSINKTAFDFWEIVDNQVNSGGSLFDIPPSPLLGNIVRTNPSGERVIGLFEVASVTKRRAFLLASVVETELPHYNSDCTLPSGSQGETPPPRPFSCCECTFLANSTDVKPSFWD